MSGHYGKLKFGNEIENSSKTVTYAMVRTGFAAIVTLVTSSLVEFVP